MHIDCRVELIGWAKMSKEKEALKNDKNFFFLSAGNIIAYIYCTIHRTAI